MKAIVKQNPGMEGVGLEEVADVEPREDEVKIKVSACGICGTDLHIVKDEYPYETPVILGHEFSGIVELTGKRRIDSKKAIVSFLLLQRSRAEHVRIVAKD